MVQSFGCRVVPIGKNDKKYLQLIPLRSVSVEARAFDCSCEVVLVQTYLLPLLNGDDAETSLDCSYSFPLDENSCVTGFEAKIGEKVLTGTVKEKEQAAAEFKAAKQNGQQALLLDQHRVNEFTVQIGLLKPGEEIEVKITYITTLDLEGPQTNRFVLPMQIAPKYSPNLYYGWKPDSNAEGATDFGFFKQMTAKAEVMSESAASSAPTRSSDIHSFLAPPKFSFQAQFYTPIGITSVTSPSHAEFIRVKDEPSLVPVGAGGGGVNSASVSLDLNQSLEGRLILERDLVILVKLAEFEPTRAMIEVDPKTGDQTVQVAFCPETFNAEMDAASLQVEMLFLIDESGSMGGSSIAAVRDTLQLFLRSLPMRCKFNLISFGSTYKTLFPESRLYSDESLASATTYVNHLSADLGGTEIHDPLAYCLNAKLDPAFPRQIFVLTDGQVSNVSQIVTLARHFCQGGRGSSTTRIFTFGIGSGVDRVLCKDLAQAGGGECEFVGEAGGAPQSKELNEKVMRQLIKSLKPAMVDVKIEWDGIEQEPGAAASSVAAVVKFEQSPRIVPPIFAPNRTVVYCTGLRLPLDGASNIRTLTITGFTNRCRDDQEEGAVTRQSWSCQIDLSKRQSGSFLAKLAARARIGELQRGGVTQPAVKDEIINLAIRHQIASNFTSFLIVDPEVDERRRQAGQAKVEASAVSEETAVASPADYECEGGDVASSDDDDEEEDDCDDDTDACAPSSYQQQSQPISFSGPSSGPSPSGPPSGGAFRGGSGFAIPRSRVSRSQASSSPSINLAPCLSANESLDSLMEKSEELECNSVQFQSRSSSLSSGGGFFSKLKKSIASTFTSSPSAPPPPCAAAPSPAPAPVLSRERKEKELSTKKCAAPQQSLPTLSSSSFSQPSRNKSSSISSSVCPPSAAISASPSTLDACFQQLLQTQSASGVWNLDDSFIQLVQAHVVHLKSGSHRTFIQGLTRSKAESLATQFNLSIQLIATLVALFLFDQVHSSRLGEVTMLMSKSKNALTKAFNACSQKGKDIPTVTQEMIAA